MKSNVINLNSPTANIYGCEPCPKCKSKYRFQLAEKPDEIRCDDCGFVELASCPASGAMSYEQICPRCRRVCFSPEEFETHECFDMDDKIDAEIALANWDGKLPEEP